MNKKIAIIEDCAEAFGTYYKNKHVGTFGDIDILSFPDGHPVNQTVEQKLLNKMLGVETT